MSWETAKNEKNKKPGFQMVPANLKSEKNPERQELPPEVAREFEQNNLKINYTPKEEAYDIMLARLINPDGSVDLSYKDLNLKLCRNSAKQWKRCKSHIREQQGKKQQNLSVKKV